MKISDFSHSATQLLPGLGIEKYGKMVILHFYGVLVTSSFAVPEGYAPASSTRSIIKSDTAYGVCLIDLTGVVTIVDQNLNALNGHTYGEVVYVTLS